MVDQAARDISSLGMNIANFAQSIERTNIARSENARNQTKFDQQQEDRQNIQMARIKALKNGIASGVIDPSGTKFTEKGLQVFASPYEAAPSKDDVVDHLEKTSGINSYWDLQAQVELNGKLLENETTKKDIYMLIANRAANNYKTNIRPNLDAADLAVRRGDRPLAAQHYSAVINFAGNRTRSKPDGDKIKYWKIIDGVRQPEQTATLEEAAEIAKSYTAEKFISEEAAHTLTGYEQSGKTFMLNSPDGKPVRAVQIMKGGSGLVDYIFFGTDGKPMKNAPDDLEQAYKKGWTQVTAEGQKAGADIALTRARTRKVEKETSEIGKPKPTKAKGEEDTAPKQGEKRMKYVDDAISDASADLDVGESLDPETKKKVEKDAEARFNQEVLGWKPVGRNKSTGEIMYQTPEGLMVNAQGRPMQPKMKLKAAHKVRK